MRTKIVPIKRPPIKLRANIIDKKKTRILTALIDTRDYFTYSHVTKPAGVVVAGACNNLK
jgi:hypothetical protein